MAACIVLSVEKILTHNKCNAFIITIMLIIKLIMWELQTTSHVHSKQFDLHQSAYQSIDCAEKKCT